MKGRIGAAAWYAATALYVAIACAWLLLGLAAALAAHTASWHAWASAAAGGRHGSAWISLGRGLIAGAAQSYPTTGVVLDYIFSAASVVMAAALFRLAPRDWTMRLLAIGLTGTGAAFNLQAHAADQILAVATGVQPDVWDTLLLHGVGGTAYVVALLLFPTGDLPQFASRGVAGRTLLLAPLLAFAALFSTLTARFPHTLTFVLFFGLLLPLEVGAAQWSRFSHAATTEVREKSRIVLWALGGAVVAAVLVTTIALSTQALQTPGLPRDVPGISLGMPGLTGELPGLGGLGTQVVTFWVFRVVSLAVPCAVLFAMLRFRLGAVELLLNRALLYGALVAMAGGAYVFVVVRVDAWFGLDSDWLAPPQVAAAGLVALAFDPLRIGLQRWADRLVFGRRVAPDEVLAQVSALSQTSGSAESLTALARIAAEGLRTGFAIVYLDLEDGTRSAYAWPADVKVGEHGPLSEIPVAYQGTAVGALAIPEASGRSSRARAEHSALLDYLTRAAAVVLHNAGLAIELERKLRVAEQHAAEMRASRWRIVAAQDSKRRHLERNLHDGAQPALTAVRLSLGLATFLASSESPKAREALARLRDQIDDASVGLRQTLRGLAPAALGEHGIGRALRELSESLATDAGIRIADETAGHRFAPEIEAAVYFCCAEAIQNAAKHCPGASVGATLRFDPDAPALSFTVTDDGPGFNATASTGSGMQNMADRIAAVGGTLTIESALGEGTTVSGRAPATPLPEQPTPSPDEVDAAHLAGEKV